jgi:hypothetical protein
MHLEHPFVDLTSPCDPKLIRCHHLAAPGLPSECAVVVCTYEQDDDHRGGMFVEIYDEHGDPLCDGDAHEVDSLDEARALAASFVPSYFWDE